MERQVIETSESPVVVIEYASGSLRMKGWDRREIRIDADEVDGVKHSQQGDEVRLKCDSGCMLRVPSKATFQVETASGDMLVKSLEGPLTIGSVGGSLVLKNVGPVNVEHIDGALNVRLVEGDLTVSTLEGDANLRDVEGNLSIEQVEGNLLVSGAPTTLAAKAEGGANLKLALAPGGVYQVASDGDIYCQIEPDSSTKLSAASGAQEIRVNTPDRSETIEAEGFELTLADGSASLILDAGGRIDFIVGSTGEATQGDFAFEFAEDLTSLADEISLQVTEQVEAQMEALNDQLEALSERLGSTASREAQAAARRAGRQVAEAQRRLKRELASTQRKAAHAARQAARRAGRKGIHKSYAWDSALGTEQSADEAVTDEERQMVLQMLQEKAISVEEAEILLAALEGETLETFPAEDQPPSPEEAAEGESGEE